jgi:hypothetical protein
MPSMKRKLDEVSGVDDNGKSGSRPKPEQSNNGCESMSNDNAEVLHRKATMP